MACWGLADRSVAFHPTFPGGLVMHVRVPSTDVPIHTWPQQLLMAAIAMEASTNPQHPSSDCVDHTLRCTLFNATAPSGTCGCPAMLNTLHVQGMHKQFCSLGQVVRAVHCFDSCHACTMLAPHMKLHACGILTSQLPPPALPSTDYRCPQHTESWWSQSPA